MANETSPSNIGATLSMRGSVVDIRFDNHLLPIYSVLRAGDESQIVIEVLAQRDARGVRGIALTPTHDLARRMTVDKAPALPAGRDGQKFYSCGDHSRQKSLSMPAQSIAERGRSGLMKEP